MTKCPVCTHIHSKGRAPAAFALDPTGPPPELCDALVSFNGSGGRRCNCNGMSAWLSFEYLERVDALADAALLDAGGYCLYVYNTNEIAVNPLNADGHYLDCKMITVFTEDPKHLVSRETVVAWLDGAKAIARRSKESLSERMPAGEVFTGPNDKGPNLPPNPDMRAA